MPVVYSEFIFKQVKSYNSPLNGRHTEHAQFSRRIVIKLVLFL